MEIPYTLNIKHPTQDNIEITSFVNIDITPEMSKEDILSKVESIVYSYLDISVQVDDRWLEQ